MGHDYRRVPVRARAAQWKVSAAAGAIAFGICSQLPAAELSWTTPVNASMDAQAGAISAPGGTTESYVIGNVAGDGTLNTIIATPSLSYAPMAGSLSISGSSSAYSLPAIAPAGLSVPPGTFDIGSASSYWNIGFQGANNDYFVDQQTGQAASDLVGDATHPVLYRYYDPSTTYGDHTHGMVYFRARIGGKNATPNWGPFDNVLSIGLDFNTTTSPFGKMDMFVMLDVHNPTGTIGVAMAGVGANTSPDTTTVGNFLTGTTTGVVRNTNTSVYNFQYVGAADGPIDLESNGAPDGWVSFGIPFNYLVTAASSQMGLSITDATPIQWGFGTSTQPNSFNQDVNGTSNRTDTWTTIYNNQNGGNPSSVGSDVYHKAVAATVTPNPVDLGRVHVGGSFGTQAITVGNNATNDGFAETLDASVGTTTGGATGTGTVNQLPAGSTNNGISVGMDASTSGQKSGTVTINLNSDGTGTSGAGQTALPSQTINVSGLVYSGLSTWSGAATSSWNDFGNWDTLGGVPGIDGALSRGHDTATFSNSGLAQNTVYLNGASPEVMTLSLTATSGSYTIAQGSGGSIRMSGSGAAINAAGVQAISAPVQLTTATQVNVAGASDRLTISGQLQGIGDLTKTGLGALVLTNTNSATGSIIINDGAVRLASGASVAGGVTVNSGAWLQGSGTVNLTLQVNDGGGVSPGGDVGIGALTIAASPTAGTSHLAGGTFRFEVAQMTGAPGSQDSLRGTGFDAVNIHGALAIDATATNKFTVDVRSLTLSRTSEGALSGWDPSREYRWALIQADGGIVGFDPAAFTIDTSAFYSQNPYLLGGNFQLEVSPDQKSINLVYAVPEPGIILTLSSVIVGGCALRPRRRIDKEPKVIDWRGNATAAEE